MLIAQPGRMGPLKLRNRIIMGPMGTNFGTTDGMSTERDKLYYGERARGGAAMIVTEAMVIQPGARNHTNSMCLFHDRYIPGLAGVVDAMATFRLRHAVSERRTERETKRFSLDARAHYQPA